MTQTDTHIKKGTHTHTHKTTNNQNKKNVQKTNIRVRSLFNI